MEKNDEEEEEEDEPYAYWPLHTESNYSYTYPLGGSTAAEWRLRWWSWLLYVWLVGWQRRLFGWLRVVGGGGGFR